MEIVQLISCIPLRSYRIIDGNLDTCYDGPRFSNHEYTSARLAMRKLKRLINKSKVLLNLDYHARVTLEHFMGTVKHYENDEDVRLLLTNPILRQLASESDRDE